MAYTTNPKMGKVRRDAVRLVKYRKWSIRMVAKHLGYSPSTVSRWCKRDTSGGWHEIPTRSSVPKTSPTALPRKTVGAIIAKRIESKRCGQVIHEMLKRDGIEVSLPSVQRTLSRCGLLKKRSPWKRLHDYTRRPEVISSGALIQIDTIHIRLPDGNKLYVYTLIDLYSRWAYAEGVERINVASTISFVDRARRKALFRFEMVQTDHGPEFSKWFSHAMERRKITHRHSRVRQCNDNAHIERFNRTIQEECLDCTANTVSNFKKVIPKYLRHYNTKRLHMGIDYLTPFEVLQRS
jgi:transposase InsO family protein